MKSFKYRVHVAVIFFIAVFTTVAQQGNNWVDGELHTFINNGAWCWFQDERSVIDTTRNKLIIGSTNSGNSNNIAIFDLDNMKVENNKRTSNLIKWCDDHNSPAVMVTANGNYLAMWAHHYDTRHTYMIYSNGSWSGDKRIEWGNWAGGQSYELSYTNLYYLSDEERIYNFARFLDNKSQFFIFSDDNGQSWDFGGKLTTNNKSAYNRGYYKYWGNGKDRIDMCFTEEHPRDGNTSIYHGYIQGHALHTSDGDVADEDMYSSDYVPTHEDFTRVFEHGTVVNGVKMGKCWQDDICRYDDGTIAVIFEARADNSETDHRNFYARYDGEEWKYTYIGKAGTKMYNDEQDYTGLAALNPDDPNRIYVSSPFNPGDDNSNRGKREIWRGTTDDHGATWEWEPVTANSSEDNFRPIIPKWKPGKEVVLWFRGTYRTAQDFSTNIVGTFYEYEVVPTSSGREEKTARNAAINFNAYATIHGSRQITMRYNVPSSAMVSLEVYSVSGKRIITLVNKSMRSGAQTVHWNTENIPAGTYLARITIGDFTRVQAVTVMR